MYQQTRVSCLVDGLDVTPLVAFVVQNRSVASFTRSTSVPMLLSGRSIGTTEVHIELCPRFNFEAAHVSGACPVGWACGGRVHVMPRTNAPGYALWIGTVNQPGSATSSDFPLPTGAVALRIFADGVTSHSDGVYVYDARNGTQLCSASHWTANMQAVCVFDDSVEIYRNVHVFVHIVKPSAHGSLTITRLHFVDANGAAIDLGLENCNRGELASIDVPPYAPSSHEVITVTDEPVTPVHLIARLITSAEWETPPPTSVWMESFSISFRLLHNLPLEGAEGHIFAEVRFSDFAFQPIQASELVITSIDDSFEALPPKQGLPYWRGRVMLDAFSHCGHMAQVQWMPHGFEVAQGTLPAKMELPPALSMSLTADQSQLTPAEDSAAAAPIHVPTTCSLQMLITFEGISMPKDYTTDPRTNVTVVEKECAYLDGTRLRMRSTCSHSYLTLIATIVAREFNFSQRLAIPIVRVHRLNSSFTALAAAFVLNCTRGTGEIATIVPQGSGNCSSDDGGGDGHAPRLCSDRMPGRH